MNAQTFTHMSETDFDQMIESYINSVATQGDDMDIALFFDLLFDRIAAQTEQTVTLAVAVHNNEVFIMPDRELGDIVVRGNEILVGGRRLIFQVSRT